MQIREYYFPVKQKKKRRDLPKQRNGKAGKSNLPKALTGKDKPGFLRQKPDKTRGIWDPQKANLRREPGMI
jgi:hypothetical protein